MSYKIAVIPGDGAGPDVIGAAVAVILAAAEKYNIELCVERLEAGGAALDRFDTPLPDDVPDVCAAADAVLMGPTGGKKWSGRYGVTDPATVPQRLCERLGCGASLCVIPTKKTVAGADGEPLTVIGALSSPPLAGLAGRDLTYVASNRSAVRVPLPAGTRVISAPAAIMRLIRDPGSFDVIVADPGNAEVLASAAALVNGFPAAAHIVFTGGATEVFAPFCSLPEELHGTGLCDPTGAILAAAMLLERAPGNIFTAAASAAATTAAAAIRGAVGGVFGSGAHPSVYADGSGEFLTTGEFTERVISLIKNETASAENSQNGPAP